MKEVNIEQRFHRNIIGAKGEKLKEIRDKFNQVSIFFPDPDLQSDRVPIRGPKQDVEACYEYLQRLNEEMKVNNFRLDLTICKQNHKFIIGKGGANVKKIKDETNTQIDFSAESTESDIITISGKKDDVLQARDKLLAIQEELDNIITQDIMIPAKLHNSIIGTKGYLIRSIIEECGDVTVQFPKGGIDSDKVSIRGPVEDVQKAKKLLIELSDEKQLTSYSAEVEAERYLHKFLIGKNGVNIKKVRDKTGVRIVFPNEKDEDQSSIIIIGRKEEVDAAKMELDEMIKELKNNVMKEVNIEQRFHRNIIGAKGEKLNELRDKFNQVSIFFPEPDLNSDRVPIRGPKQDVEACYEYLQRLNEEMKVNNFRLDLTICKQNHKFIIGKGGANVKKIKDETNTRIDFPAEGTESDIVTISGKKDDVLRARDKLLAMQEQLKNNVTKEVNIEPRFHGNIIGAKGEKLKEIRDKFNQVSIFFPEPDLNSDRVPIRGPKQDVEACYEYLQRLNEEMKVNNFRLDFTICKQNHKFIIGKGGANVIKIRDETNTRIDFPAEGTESDIVTIRGNKDDVLQARDKLLAIQEALNDVVEVMIPPIDPKHYGYFFAGHGEVLKQIQEEFEGIFINFPRKGTNNREVILKGAKDAVEGAKQRLEEIVKELDQIVTIDCIIPQEHHGIVLGTKGSKVQNIQRNFNVNIKFPYRERVVDTAEKPYTNEDYHTDVPDDDSKNVIKIKGKLENCESAKQALLYLVPVTEEMEVPYDLHGSIIGQKGKDVRSIAEQFDVYINIPSPSNLSNTILIKGFPAKVALAKEALRERIEQLVLEKQYWNVDMILIDPKHYGYFFAGHGEVLKQIQDEFDGVFINFPIKGTNNSEVTLRGAQDAIEGAKKRLQEIVKELDQVVTIDCIIPQEHHGIAMGTKGFKVQNIQRQFNVSIKFPYRERVVDIAEKHVMNEDYHTDVPSDDTKNIIKIKGKLENCESAKQALLDLVPVTEEMEVPYDLHGFIIGRKGKDVRSIVEQFDVYINIPSQSNRSNNIAIKGLPPKVALAKEALRKRIEQLELEKQDWVLENYQLTVDVDPQHHSKIIGRGGAVVNNFQKDHNVIINLPHRGEANERTITIIGYEKDAEAAKEAILKLVEEQVLRSFQLTVDVDPKHYPKIIGPGGTVVNKIWRDHNVHINFPEFEGANEKTITITGFEKDAKAAKEAILKLVEQEVYKEEVRIDSRIHSRIIGSHGSNVLKIMDQYKVDIRFPKSTDPNPDLVVIEGEEDNVLDAMDYLLNMEEEYKQRYKEKVPIDSRIISRILGTRGHKVLEFMDKYKVDIQFPKFTDPNPDFVVIQGQVDDVLDAKNHLLSMEEEFVRKSFQLAVDVDPQYHSKIIGRGGAVVKNIQKDHNVAINFPERGGANERTITITGYEKDAEAAKKAILKLVQEQVLKSFQLTLDVDPQHYPKIIGAGGAVVNKIRTDHDVHINFPERAGANERTITITGYEKDAKAAKEAIIKLVEQEVLRSFQLTVDVDPQHYPKIIGPGGTVVNKIWRDHNVHINFPEREGANERTITITGYEKDAKAAKEAILKLVEQEEGMYKEEVPIDPRIHSRIIGTHGRNLWKIMDKYKVDIRFPKSTDPNPDLVVIQGEEDNVLDVKDYLLNMEEEFKGTYKEEVSIDSRILSRILGTRGHKVLEFMDMYKVDIQFPKSTDPNQDFVVIQGQEEDVLDAKNYLLKMEEEFVQKSFQLSVNIDSQHHSKIIGRGGAVVKNIQKDHNVIITFPERGGTNESTITITGYEKDAEAAKESILKLVQEQVRRNFQLTVDVDPQYHSKIIGRRGAVVNSIQKDHNVNIIFPERGGANKRTITISGYEKDAEAAKEAILKLVQEQVLSSFQLTVDVDPQHLPIIIGRGGAVVNKIRTDHDVYINFPKREGANEGTITISGYQKNVEDAKEAILRLVQEQVRRSFQLSIDVDPQHYPKIIGRGGVVVKNIQKDHNVIITFPERGGTNESTIMITGYEKDAEAAKEAILKLVEEQEDIYKEEVSIDSRIHSRIIGVQGRNVMKIMDQYKVDIRFPRSTDRHSDLVVIEGAKDDVLDAKDYLLNMEEEFIRLNVTWSTTEVLNNQHETLKPVGRGFLGMRGDTAQLQDLEERYLVEAVHTDSKPQQNL